MSPRGGRFELRNASMVDLITRAYNVTDDKVSGGPNWLASDRFDVIARTPPNVSVETARLMLQSLLADRFALKIHNDNKPLPTYALTLGKGAHKLKKSDGSQNGCQGQPQGQPQPGVIPLQVVSCHNLTTAQIAENLHQMANGYIDHPVVDQTNLQGAWDFDLKWTARGLLAQAGADGISVFDAVDKQLCLKLELRQIAAAVIVVDSVDRKPTDNPAGVAEALPPEKPEFEAAEIKPSDPGTQGVGIQYTQGGRINARGTLRDLIGMANQILPNTVADFIVGPKFIETTHWTIVAKAPSTGIGAPTRDGGRDIPPPINVALMMLRNTLEERFKLQMHTENRPVTVYALVAKSESKMKKAEASERAGCKPDPGAVPANAGGPMQAFTCTNETLAEFIKLMPQMASAYIDHPVIDNSGLQGGYDFTVLWTPRGALPGGGQPGATGAVDPGGVTYFEAIEKLGLKLEKGTHSVPVIIIDHAEEKPID
ncbi:MAG TPA: TIGR03435 family protein [Terriglobia bacterium]